MTLRLQVPEIALALLHCTKKEELTSAIASVSAKLGSDMGDTERGLLTAARWWVDADSTKEEGSQDSVLLNLSTEQESLAALTFLGSLSESARGETYARLGERLIERWPDSATCWYHYGQMSLSLGQRERARQAFERSYDIVNTEEAGIAWLETTCSKAPEEVVEKWAEQILSDFPQSGQVFLAVGTLFRNWGLWERAEPYLEFACQHSRDLLGAQWELAVLHYLRGAIKQFEQVFMRMAPRTDEQLMAKILYLLLKRELENIWRVFLQVDERRVPREALAFVCMEILVSSIRHERAELTKSVLGTIRTYRLFSKRVLYWMRHETKTKRWLRRFEMVVRVATDHEFDGISRYLRVLRVWANDAASASVLALDFLTISEPPAQLLVQSTTLITKKRELALQYCGVDEYLQRRILEG